MNRIREIEKIVDAYHLSSTFLNKPYKQAIFDLLRVYEDSIHLSEIVNTLKGGALSYDGIKRDLMDALNMALGWVYEKQTNPDHEFSFDISPQEYGKAQEFLCQFALPYSKVCDAYIAYSRGKFEGTVGDESEGLSMDVFFKATDSQMITFSDEMSEYFEKADTLPVFAKKISAVLQSKADIIQNALSTVHFEETKICYECDNTVLDVFRNIADLNWEETSILPKYWSFSNFTLDDFRRCWRELFAISYFHTQACMKCKDGMAFKDCIIVQKRTEVISYICKQISRPDAVISEDQNDLILETEKKSALS